MYSLTSKWTIKQGKEKTAIGVLKRLAQQVQKNEPDTLIYLVHTPDMTQESLPTPSNLEVVFFEVYKNKAAFQAHVKGPDFTNFVANHLDLFLSTTSQTKDGESVSSPYTITQFFKRQAGFIREATT